MIDSDKRENQPKKPFEKLTMEIGCCQKNPESTSARPYCAPQDAPAAFLASASSKSVQYDILQIRCAHVPRKHVPDLARKCRQPGEGEKRRKPIFKRQDGMWQE